MAFKFLKHRWQKNLLTAFLILTAIILIVGFLVNKYLSPVIEDKVKSGILESTHGLYHVNFADVSIHVFQRKIVVFNITVKSDSAVYNALKKRGIAPNNLLSAHIKRLVITNIDPIKLIFNHTLDINQISLSAPEINISYRLNHVKDTTLTDNRTAWQKISKIFRTIHVNDIMLNDVQLRYDDFSGNKVAISELKEMNIHANDLLIDSLTQTDKTRFLFCRDIVAELNNYTGKTPSGLYTYTINHLKLSSLTSQLNAEGIAIKPIATNHFFDKSLNDSYTVKLESIEVNHFDYLNYHKYRAFSASSVILDKGVFALYANPNRGPNNADKIKSFPAVMLANLKMDLKVDTLLVKHLDISYSEFNYKSKETGTISFDNTNGQFLNITNNKTALQKNNICTVRVNSYFMNRGELNVLFNFNLADVAAAYSYKGNLGVMDLRAVNVASMPLGMVKISSGRLKKLDFDFKANSKVANGRVTVLYNDLKVTILKPDTEVQNGDLKKQRIASLFANLFILKHNNPDKDGLIPRSLNLSFPRPQNATFFNYLWKTLFEGVKFGVGFDKKTQESAKAMAAQSVINKQNRKIKKEQRKQRREDRRQKREAKKLLSAQNNAPGNGLF